MNTGKVDEAFISVQEFADKMFAVASKTGDTVVWSYANMLMRTHPSAFEDVLVQMVHTYADNRRFLLDEARKALARERNPPVTIPNWSGFGLSMEPGSICSVSNHYNMPLKDVYFMDWIKSLWGRLRRGPEPV